MLVTFVGVFVMRSVLSYGILGFRVQRLRSDIGVLSLSTTVPFLHGNRFNVSCGASVADWIRVWL